MVRNAVLICILLRIANFVIADRSSIIFLEDDDDDSNSFAARFNLDMDDMEYDQDNGNDSLIPKLVLDRDEEQNYIALPDKEGQFQVVPRLAVIESRKNSTRFEAADFVKFHFYARSNNYQPVELRYDQIRFLPDHHGFNVKLPTKILVHGWLGGSDSDVIEPLAMDFLEQDETRITFVEDDEDEASNGTQPLDQDDMEYEQDNEGDTLIPQLRMSHELQENYITLPDKDGDFQIVPRFSVREGRRNSSHFDAAKYVRFRFYTSSSRNQSAELGFDQIHTLPYDYGFNVLLPTMVLIHGWLGSSESEVIEPLAQELLEHTNMNVLAVDWEKGASTLLYPVARYRVPKVGKLVAAVIDRFLDFGQTPEQIGIIGHSLGAHIAGIAGKNTRRKIACIVGLDPASPLFRLKKPSKRLSDTDAQYVEVIHTNGKALGIFARIGVTDFYPNGGAKQPGCGWNISCSHQRAVDYFKESLKTRNYFANRCNDEKGLDSNCSLGVASLGGFRALGSRGKPRGVYYAQTAKSKPFLRS